MNVDIESLINCPRCGSNACMLVTIKNIVIEHNTTTFKSCMGCGFSNSYVDEKTLPELYKDIKFIDEDGNYWYPSVIKIDTKGMVFADGTNKNDWEWKAVLAVKEKGKYKIDMSVSKNFKERDYMDALEYIGYFK